MIIVLAVAVAYHVAHVAPALHAINAISTWPPIRAEPGGFEVKDSGWVKFAAFTSALAAFGTVYLGWETRKLGSETKTLAEETRAVVRNEDRRFQLARMPVLRIDAPQQHVGQDSIMFFTVRITNLGEGPALNVRLSMYCLMKTDYSERGAAERNAVHERKFNLLDTVVSAYIPATLSAELEVSSGDYVGQYFNARTTTYVRNTRLTYNDAFGGEYSTEYAVDNLIEHLPEDFKWIVPTHLEAQSLKRQFKARGGLTFSDTESASAKW